MGLSLSKCRRGRLVSSNYFLTLTCTRKMALKLLKKVTTCVARTCHSWRWMSTPPSSSVNHETRNFQEMPTEWGSRLFGAGRKLFEAGPHEFIGEMKEKHGKVFRVRAFAGKYLVVVADVDGAETVLRNEGKYPSRGDTVRAFNLVLTEYNRMNGLPSSATSLTAVEGEEWKELRSTMNPVFVPRKLGRHVHKLNAVHDTFVRLAQEGADTDGYSKDLMELLPYWSMEAISRFLLPQGIQFQGLNADVSGADIVEGFMAFLQNIPLCNIYPSWWLKTFPVKAYKLASEGYARSISVMKVLVEEAIEKHSSVKDEEDQTFLEKWVEQGMDAVDIVHHLSAFTIAGVDTTANTAAFALYHLAKHPEAQEEARKEVLSLVGRDGDIDDTALQKMSYIKSCLKESIRLHPTVGAHARSLPVDMEIGGYVVPKETPILVSTMMGRDPDYFEDPLLYNPGRWLRSENSMGISPFLANTFGFGTRMCLGRRVAELEMWSLLAKMLQKTKLELHKDSDNIGQTGRGTLRPGKPLRVKFSTLT